MVEETEFSSSSDEGTEGTEAVGTTESDESGKSGRDAASRINELVGKTKAQEEELDRIKQELESVKQVRLTGSTGDTPNPATTPDGQKALAYLTSIGVPTEEKVQERIKQLEDRIILNNEHGRLASSYDGSDGRPQYNKAKIEQYMRDNGVFNPEIAYKALNESELLDWNLKKTNGAEKGKAFVERPGTSTVNRSDRNAVTREKLAEHMQNPTPASKLWYERNRLKAMDMMAKGEL